MSHIIQSSGMIKAPTLQHANHGMGFYDNAIKRWTKDTTNSMETIVDEALTKASRIARLVEKGLALDNARQFAHKVKDIVFNSAENKMQLAEGLANPGLEKKLLADIVESSIGIDHHKMDVSRFLSYISGDKGCGTKMKLSDPSGAALGNYTLQVAQMFILEFGSNLDQSKFALRKYFPQMPISAMQFQIDRSAAIYGRLGAADAVNNAIRDPLQNYGVIWESQEYNDKLTLYPRDMLFTREKGAPNFSSGVAGLQQRLGIETLCGTVRIESSMNLDLADAALRNGYAYPPLSPNLISMGVPTANTYVFSTPLGTYDSTLGSIIPNSNCDPMRELGAMLPGFLALRRANRYAREIILHPLVWNAITQNPNVQSYLKLGHITGQGAEQFQGQLQYFTIPGFDVPFVTEDLSWNPQPTNQLTNDFAINQYVMGGNNWNNITNSTFNGFIGVDPSSQGGTLGGVVLSPNVLSGGAMNGSSGYGVQVFDKTFVEPENPRILVIPYISYAIALWMREAIYNIDFQILMA